MQYYEGPFPCYPHYNHQLFLLSQGIGQQFQLLPNHAFNTNLQGYNMPQPEYNIPLAQHNIPPPQHNMPPFNDMRIPHTLPDAPGFPYPLPAASTWNHPGSSVLPTISFEPPIQIRSSATPPPVQMVKNPKRLTKERRIEMLQNDHFVSWFTGTLVACSGCTREIKMDSRDGAQYYLQAWTKHRSRCKGVEDGIVSDIYAFSEKVCY